MKVKITETVLRDSQQSLIATRMPFSDFEGILETLDNAGCIKCASYDVITYTREVLNTSASDKYNECS